MSPRIIDTADVYRGWTRLRLLRLRFDDGQEVTREVEDHGRSVAVLPYDPARRTAVLVRLPRAPVLLTSGVSDLLEVPAGLVEEGDPAETARRELYEETGLQVRGVEHVGNVWSMPGISTEQMDLYLARYSAEDRTGPGGGLADEHENITVVEMPLDELWARLLRNEIADMKTLALLLILHTRKPQLFAHGADEPLVG